MLQAQITTQWLLEGFKYDLAVTSRPRTVEYYYEHVCRFERWMRTVGRPFDILLISKRDIQAFFHHLAVSTENGEDPGRVERHRWPYYRALRRFFAWAVEEGYLEQSPMDGIRFKAPQAPVVEPYRPEHIGRMLELLDYRWKLAKTPHQKMLVARDRAILVLFLESGLRLGELAGLTTGDIDLERQRVMVWHGKLGKSRITGFGPQTKRALWKYLGLRGVIQTNVLWLTEEGQPLAGRGVQEVISRLKKDAGIGHVRGSVHKLRHTFATSFLKHTRDMKGCRLLLGHSTMAMTERYTQFIEAEDALRAYEAEGPLDWLNRQGKNRRD